MSFQSVKDIWKAAEEQQIPLWQVILREDLADSRLEENESLEKMKLIYRTMKEAYRTYRSEQKSRSALVGGDGEKIRKACQAGTAISGEYMGKVMEIALKMGECNACMRRIVAAPTAGACGVIPAVYVAYEEVFREKESKMIEGLYIASGIGEVIASRAFIAGAAGGCQAEIGAASAMAAAGLTYIRGGDIQQIEDSAAMALANLLGLVCDPVAGLVEVPCVKRNVIGAVNAVSCSEMAMAGISNVISADEVFDAMKEVGEALPASLRETGKGGLAGTPTGRAIATGMKSQ